MARTLAARLGSIAASRPYGGRVLLFCYVILVALAVLGIGGLALYAGYRLSR